MIQKALSQNVGIMLVVLSLVLSFTAVPLAAAQSTRVKATSSNANATLKEYVTSTNALIGTLRNDGGGRYRADFSWPANPQNITVRSSFGGSASRTVTVK